MEATTVVIIGAGSSGLATAACLTTHSIPYILLERDHCIASLWRNRAYDRVTLHIAKQYCQLPHAPHPASTPTFIPKRHFIEYLEGYAAKFRIQPRFGMEVESAWFDEGEGKWRVMARKGREGEVVELKARFVVVASGENDEAVVPEIEGLDGFVGDLVHSNRYRSGSVYKGKSVLVVGSGNSGMEIAFDLWSFGAFPSIVVRSPMHVVSKEIWLIGMLLSKYLSITWVDIVVLLLCYFKFGNTSKYGLCRPSEGPFYYIANTQGFFPTIDTGTFAKIKSGEIQCVFGCNWFYAQTGRKTKFWKSKSHSGKQEGFHWSIVILRSHRRPPTRPHRQVFLQARPPRTTARAPPRLSSSHHQHTDFPPVARDQLMF